MHGTWTRDTTKFPKNRANIIPSCDAELTQVLLQRGIWPRHSKITFTIQNQIYNTVLVPKYYLFAT